MSKFTSLYAEIEGDKSIENQMNTFVQEYSIPKIKESKTSSSYHYCGGGGGWGGLSHGSSAIPRKNIFDTPKKNNFYEEGKLTPEEFVEAGDFLISKCPIWKWCAAKENLYNKTLPKDKQYLKTTVPSFKRVSDYLKSIETIEKILDGDRVYADLENKVNKDVTKPATIDLNFNAGTDKKMI